MRRFIAALVELVRSWWHVDRVRVSPWEGRLLRIMPGTILTVEGEHWEVTGRTRHELESSLIVRYACRGKSDGEGEMWVPVEPQGSIVWLRHGVPTQLMADDVKVWGKEGYYGEGEL